MFSKSSFQSHFLKRTITMQQQIEMNKNSLNDYKAAICKLNQLQSNANYISQASSKSNNNVNKLADMKKFLERSGLSLDRLDDLSVIHVTGTKGKGTTCAFCETVLRAHGFKTGFYSSPHLFEVRERIRINGRPISESQFATAFWKIYDKLEKHQESPTDMPLYFRFLTIMAFHVFLEQKVDVAIVEVGIGGEYDCTNIMRKVPVVGISSLGMDHEVLLGNTLESIAWNKAGIMKKDCKAFTVPQPDSALKVLKERSLEKNCTLTVLDNTPVNLNGNYTIPKAILQANASLALNLSKTWMESKNKLFSEEIAEYALKNCKWPGRFHILHRDLTNFYLDGAHTYESIQICTDWFQNLTFQSPKRVLIFNLTGNRNAQPLLRTIQSINFHTAIFVTNIVLKDTNDSDKQFLRCKEYEQFWREINGNDSNTMVFNSIEEALDFVGKSGEKCDVLVTGSLHLVGGVLSLLEPTLND